MAIDGNDWIAASVLGNGFYKTQSIRMQKQFGDKIEKGAMFITDSESSLTLFSKNNDPDHIKIPSGHHATNDGKYNINTINGIHSEVKLFLKPFRGISTRHIATYVGWFRRLNISNIIMTAKNGCLYYINCLLRRELRVKLDSKITIKPPISCNFIGLIKNKS